MAGSVSCFQLISCLVFRYECLASGEEKTHDDRDARAHWIVARSALDTPSPYCHLHLYETILTSAQCSGVKYFASDE